MSATTTYTDFLKKIFVINIQVDYQK